VDVTIQGQGWPLTPQMLGLEYHNWIQDCNKKYDTDECREDQSKRLRQICATEFHSKLEMGITQAGIRERVVDCATHDSFVHRIKLGMESKPTCLGLVFQVVW